MTIIFFHGFKKLELEFVVEMRNLILKLYLEAAK